jgi:hypothetical protein
MKNKKQETMAWYTSNTLPLHILGKANPNQSFKNAHEKTSHTGE